MGAVRCQPYSHFLKYLTRVGLGLGGTDCPISPKNPAILSTPPHFPSNQSKSHQEFFKWSWIPSFVESSQMKQSRFFPNIFSDMWFQSGFFSLPITPQQETTKIKQPRKNQQARNHTVDASDIPMPKHLKYATNKPCNSYDKPYWLVITIHQHHFGCKNTPLIILWTTYQHYP